MRYQEGSRFWSVAPGVELSRYVLRGGFPRHLHLGGVVVLIESGSQILEFARGAVACRPGDVVLIAPEEAHRNFCREREEVGYRTYYLRPDRLPFCPNLGLRIRDRRIRRRAMFERLRELHRWLEEAGVDPSDVVAELIPLFDDRVEIPRGLAACVQETRAIVHERYANPLTIAELASRVGVSTSYLSRRFRSDLGLSPHAYLDAVRIERARDRIRSGISFARTAVECGFYDQSHLIRRFRRLVGQTPAAFAGVQERPIPALREAIW